MPIVQIQGLGNVEFPDTMSQQDIVDAIQTHIMPKVQATQPAVTPVGQPVSPTALTPPPPAQTQDALSGAFGRSLYNIGADIDLLKGKITGNTEEAEKRAKELRQWGSNVYHDTEKGWTEAPGTKIAELLGGSLPYMAAPAAAAMLTPELAIGLGITAADITAGLVSATQFTGSNLARQTENEKKTLAEASLLNAGAAAIPQALLDVTGLKYIPGIRRVFGEAGVKITDDVAEQLVKKNILAKAGSVALQTGKTMGVEGATEAAQQLFERLQAGLSITDADARKEYYDNFIGGAVLGGALAGPGIAAENLLDKSKAKTDTIMSAIEQQLKEGKTGEEPPAPPPPPATTETPTTPPAPPTPSNVVTLTQLENHAKTRLEELEAKANGKPAIQTTDEQGNPITLPAQPAQAMTEQEVAELKFLQEHIGNTEKLAQGYGVKIADNIYHNNQAAIDELNGKAMPISPIYQMPKTEEPVTTTEPATTEPATTEPSTTEPPPQEPPKVESYNSADNKSNTLPTISSQSEQIGEEAKKVVNKDKPVYAKVDLNDLPLLLGRLFLGNPEGKLENYSTTVHTNENKVLPKTKQANQITVQFRPDTIIGEETAPDQFKTNSILPRSIESITVHNVNSRFRFPQMFWDLLDNHFTVTRNPDDSLTYTLRRERTAEQKSKQEEDVIKKFEEFLKRKKGKLSYRYKVVSRPGLNKFQQLIEKYDTVGDAFKDILSQLEQALNTDDATNEQNPLLAKIREGYLNKDEIAGYIEIIKQLMKIEPVMLAHVHVEPTIVRSRGHGVNGFYNPYENLIALFATSKLKTFIHETIHAAALHEMRMNPNGEFALKIKKLLRASKKAANGEYFYGHTDPDEFLAEAFSNYDFMKHLAKTKSVFSDLPKTSLFDDFRNIVRRLFNVSSEFRSLFDDVMDLSDTFFTGKTLESFKKDRYSFLLDKEKALIEKVAGWTPSRIENIWRTYMYTQNGREKDTKAYATMISPDQFLGLTMSESHFETLLKDNEIRNKIRPLDLEHLKNYDLPLWLDVTEKEDGTWQVTGHEGRHRMVALYRAGVTQVPIVIRTKDVKARDIVNNAKLLPQKFDKSYGVNGATLNELIPINYENKSNIIHMAEEPDIRFSIEEAEHEEGSRQIFNYRGQPVDIRKWQIPSMSKIAEKLDHVFWAWADEHSTLDKVQKAIKALGRTISDMSNMARKMELRNSKITDRLEHFVMDEVNPIIKKMLSFNVSLDDIKQYLHARHAEEYNNRMNEINHRVDNQGNIIPYALKDKASGMTTENARNYLNSLDPAREAELREIADMFYAIRDKTQQILVESGQETQETIDLWNEIFPDYVPLNREQEEQAVPAGLRTGVGVDVRGNFAKRAMGSELAIINPIDALLYQRERAIARAENNEVSKSVYRLALENPNPDFWMAINPDAIHNREALIEELLAMGYTDAEGIADNIMAEPKERYLRRVRPSDFVIDPNTGLVIPNSKEVVDARISRNARFGDNVITLKINGRERYVFFNQKDPLAVRMVRSLKNLEAEKLGPIIRFSRKITHYFGQINTVVDPVFSMVNGLKDYPFAMANLSTTPLKGQQAEVTANIFPAMGGIITTLRKQKAGDNTVDSEWQKIYKEAKAAGFQTANRYAVLKSGEDKAYIEQTMNKFTEGNSKKAFKYVVGMLYDFGSMVENGVRLAAYKAAKDKGMSPEEAASLAKNLTVNFDKKGARTGTIRSLYLFFNASIRSSVRLGETLNGPTGKYIIAGGVLLGVMQAIMLAAAGFKDDDPPEYIKEHNLIIPTSDGKYATIPLAYGLNVLPNIGRIFTEYGQDVNQHGWQRAKAMKRAMNLTNSFFSAFSPFGNQGLSPLSIIPSTAEPLVGLAINKNAFGQTISRQDSYTRPTPGYTRTRETGSSAGKEIARLINLMGGTDYAKSEFWSPTGDDIDFLIGSVTGGPGREISKIGQYTKNQISGEQTPAYRVPVVGRFYGETDTKPVISSRFYNNINQMYAHENTIKNLAKDPVAKREYLKDNPDARLWPLAEQFEAKINELNATKKKMEMAGRPKEQIDRIDNKKIIIMNRFNDRLEKAKTQ